VRAMRRRIGARPAEAEVAETATPAVDTLTRPEEATSASRRAGRNVVAVMAGEILGKVATLAFTVILARQLGASGFGAFSYALALGLLLGTFTSWGFDADVLRRGSADPADLDTALGQALLLRGLHAVVVLPGGALYLALARPDVGASVATVLVVVATLLDSVGDAGRAAATARERPAWSSFALVFQRSAACVLAIVALSLGGDLVAVSAMYLISSGLGLVALTALLRRLGVRPAVRHPDRAGLARMWRGTFLLGLDVVVAMALFRVDALLLGALVGARQVAEYMVAYRLVETVMFVSWAVARSLFPAMARARAGRPLLAVADNALAVAGALLVPYGVVVLVDGERLVGLIFGGEYGGDAVTSLYFLAFSPLAFSLAYLCGYVLFAQGRLVQVVVASTAGLAVNVVLNLVLIPVYGAPGAAFATLVSYAAEGVLSVFLIAPGTGILRWDRSIRLGLVASIPMAVVLLTVQAPVLVELGVAAVLYVPCYLALARWWAPEQLTLLRSLLSRG
jgi:O-antigen/teichoic acid export membrane protein